MSPNERVEQIITGIRPMLVMQEKDVNLVEASDERIRLALKGFCGGCSCSQDYVDGLKDMLTEEFPNTEIVILSEA